MLRALLVLTASLAIAVAACEPGPGPTAVPSPSTAAISASPATPANGTPSASASAAVPSTPATPCPGPEQAISVPSDRLVNLVVSSSTTQDLVTFVFEPSSPGPGGPPSGTLAAVRPPFSFAGSGQSIELRGEHALQVRFSGMTIASEKGGAFYAGPPDVEPDLPALRQAIQYDASEGVIGWYIGYDGPGCVTIDRSGDDVTVAIGHP